MIVIMVVQLIVAFLALAVLVGMIVMGIVKRQSRR